jgi:hypothetical protein
MCFINKLKNLFQEESMISKLTITAFTLVLITGCTYEELGNAAYGSLGSTECQKTTGGQGCDLDMRSTDERLMTGGTSGLSNDELEKEAQKKQTSLNKNK